MCDIGMAFTIGATVLGGIGALQQAKATSDANTYNAQVAEMNRQLADRAAKDAIERGKLDEQRKRQQVAQLQGAQLAAMAANGVDVTFGSPLDNLVDTATMGEIDALTIRTNANREAYDDKVNGVGYAAQAAQDRAAASNAMTGGYLNALGTVLTGAGKAYQMGYDKGYWGAGSPLTVGIG